MQICIKWDNNFYASKWNIALFRNMPPFKRRRNAGTGSFNKSWNSCPWDAEHLPIVLKYHQHTCWNYMHVLVLTWRAQREIQPRRFSIWFAWLEFFHSVQSFFAVSFDPSAQFLTKYFESWKCNWCWCWKGWNLLEPTSQVYKLQKPA